MKVLSLALVILLVGACQRVDDQRLIVSKEQKAIVNPLAQVENPAESNAKHQVLVAVVDTGIDYNHPYLKNSIHYTLGEEGITRIGYDFIGDDRFASPYLGITADLTDRSSSSDREDLVKMRKGLEIFLNEHPLFKKYFHPLRAFDQESGSGFYHGTHVAGLIAYDDERIGLLPYRVLPTNREWAENKLEYSLVDALVKATKDGAKIINLSLGAFKAGVEPDSDFDKVLKEIQKFALDNPQVLLVAAAGNDGKWLDPRTRRGYPCGVVAPNILCVGSLGEDGAFSDFTNIPLLPSGVVFTLGEDVISTMPTSSCSELDNRDFEKLAEDDVTTDRQAELMVKYADKIKTKCEKKRTDFGKLSGTSMATPLIARVLAQQFLANGDPNISGEELMKLLFSDKNTRKRVLGNFTYYDIQVTKPSWYSDPDVTNNILDSEDKDDSETFSLGIISGQ